MPTAFIIHGLGGDPDENWFPWLRAELVGRGWTVNVPQMPGASAPILSEWMQHFAEYQSQLTQQSVLVGHSLGGTFILRFLEQYLGVVDTVIIVASPVQPMGNALDSHVSTFFVDAFQWEQIRSKAKRFILMYSDNDPYVSPEQATMLADGLQATIHLFPGAGHFNQSSGHTQLPELLTFIP
jgi:uncharacterized protein